MSNHPTITLTHVLLVVGALVALTVVLVLLFGPEAALGPVALVVAGAGRGEHRRRKAAKTIRQEKRAIKGRDSEHEDANAVLLKAAEEAKAKAAAASLADLVARDEGQ